MLNCAVDHILQEFYTLFWPHLEPTKLLHHPQTKMTSKDDIKGLVSLKFLRPCLLYWLTYHLCSPEKIMFCPDPLHKYSIITGGGYLCWFRLISCPKVLLQSSQAKGRRALGWERRACASRPCALEKSFSHYTDRTQLLGGYKDMSSSWLTNSALVYEPKYGGRGGVAGFGQWVQMCTGAQINFGDLTPYLTCVSYHIIH